MMVRALVFCLVAGVGPLLTAGAMPAKAQTAPNTQQDAQQLFERAMALHSGVGVIQNFAQARQLLTQSAAQGFVPAIHQLGLYARSGIGGPVDLKLSLDLLSRAAQTGHPAYQFDYAETLATRPEAQADFHAVAALFELAAAQGHVDAAVELGVLLQSGEHIPQNFARALEYFEQAAAQDDAKALNNLGALYARGSGVDQDYGRAAQYFQRAADLGLSQGMTNLSVLYENGFGVPLDEARAKELARQAGQNATQQAQQRIDFVAEPRIVSPTDLAKTLERAQLGDPISQIQIATYLIAQKEYHTAHDWLQSAAGKGMPWAMTNLGISYSKGLGVPQDYVLAHAWLTVAQAKGQPDIGVIIGALIPQMTQSQVEESQGIALKIWEKIEQRPKN